MHTRARPIKNLLMAMYKRLAVASTVNAGRALHVGLGTRIWAPNSLEIGDDVYIGKHCTVECDGRIGNSVMIANNVGIIGRHDHDISAVGLSVREAPWIGDRVFSSNVDRHAVSIGDDVWIGFGAIVLSGVVVGRGAIVGAGAVVTRNLPPYSLSVGNPAHVVRYRFSKEQIQMHERALYGQLSVPSRTPDVGMDQ